MKVEAFLKRNYKLHHVIVIPHYDDEIIGCYQLFVDATLKSNEAGNDSSIVVMPINCSEMGMEEYDLHRRKESLQITDHFRAILLGKRVDNISIRGPLSLSVLSLSPLKHIYANCAYDGKLNCVWFPDPLYEKHSEHMLLGNFGILLSSTALQNSSASNVIFGYYSINMQAPYVQPLSCKEADGKARVCEIFTSQAGYFASHGEATRFEGRRLA